MNTTPVKLQEEYAKTEIAKILNVLNEELVGLAPVKARIREIAALLLIDKLRRNLGITAANPGLHMSFTGSPGTGKTTVGLKLADILYQLGYIKKGHLLTVTRDDLVVVLAGYKQPMDKFFESNPGLSSRIANHIDFPDYSTEELLKIAKLMLEEQQYQLTPDAEVALESYIQKRKEQPLFANARSIKNALDRARMRQANRIFDSRGQVLTKKELVNLEAEDFLQSTVFSN